MDEIAMEQVDSLLESSFAPERPMSAPDEGVGLPSEGAASAEGTSHQVADGSWVIVHNGKEIPLDDHKYKMYAQKGYDYQDKMHQLRVDRNLYAKEREEFEASRTAFQTEAEELRQIQEYAKANPQWLDTVRTAWQQVQQQGGGQYSYQNPELQQMRSVVDQMAARLAEQDKQASMRAIAEKEAMLETQIANYKDAHADFDWNTEDESGLRLEQRIMQHAIDNGIKSFQAAGRDYMWDEHMTRAQLQTKERVGKEIQKQTRLGLGTPTARSQMKVTSVENLRSKSYDDIASEALRELGLKT